MVSGLVRNSKPAITVTGLLQSELEYWRFLDDWSDCLPWRSERHIAATLYCDASKRTWGGVLMTDNSRMEAGDYWQDDSGSINFLEAKALLCALDAFKSRIRSSYVDVHTDSRALLGSWQSEGGSNTEINDVIKANLRCSQEFRLTCNTFLRLRTWPTLPRVVSQTSIVPFWRRRGPVSRECFGHIPLTSCRSTVTAIVICVVIVFHISHSATPLSHPASTCLHNSCLSGKTFMFSPLCTYRSAPLFLN